MAKQTAENHRRPTAKDTDAVLRACRVLVAISVASLNAIEDDVTAEQLRILVVVSARRMTLSELAAATGMHLSKASRACHRMVGLGLMRRSDDPADRRSLRLDLTEHGERILTRVAGARRTAIAPALRRMDPARRADLVAALTEFTAASGDSAGVDLATLGWTS